MNWSESGGQGDCHPTSYIWSCECDVTGIPWGDFLRKVSPTYMSRHRCQLLLDRLLEAKNHWFKNIKPWGSITAVYHCYFFKWKRFCQRPVNATEHRKTSGYCLMINWMLGEKKKYSEILTENVDPSLVHFSCVPAAAFYLYRQDDTETIAVTSLSFYLTRQPSDNFFYMTLIWLTGMKQRHKSGIRK